MDTASTSAAPELRSARKSVIGRVISDKMEKTRVVLVSWQSTHPRYHKVVRRSSKFYAHDDANESHVGDRVEIMETRPLSKLKRWRVARVIEKAV